MKADSFFNFFDPPQVPDDPTAEVDECTQVQLKGRLHEIEIRIRGLLLQIKIDSCKNLVVGDTGMVPSKRVMSSPFEHKTIFFSEFRLGDLMLYVATKFN